MEDGGDWKKYKKFIYFFIKCSIIIVTVVSVVTAATIFNRAKLSTSIIFSLSLIYYNLGKLVHLL